MKCISTSSFWLRTVTLLALGWGAGCADPRFGLLSGEVTIDGKPAEEGSIAFFPLDGKSSTAGGVIQDGRYSAKVPPGMVRVEIRVPKVVGEKKLYDAPKSPVQPLLAELLPPRYNDRSELRISVVPGRAEQNFALTID